MQLKKKVRTHGRSPAHARAWVRHPQRGAEQSARLPAARGRSKATGVEKLLTTPPLTSGTRRAVYRRHRQHPRGQGSSKLDLARATPGGAAGVASIPHIAPNVNGALSTVFQHLVNEPRGGRSGRKKFPASKKIPAFYSGDIYDSNVQLCYTFVYLECPGKGTLKCPADGTITRLLCAAF